MIRRLLLRALPEDWRDAVEGDLMEGTPARRRGRHIRILAMLAVIVVRFAWARGVERAAPRRPVRPGAWIADAVLDGRQGVRRWRARPGLALAALATIALGIGTTSALFSVVDGILLKPLPYPDPGQLVTINRTYPDWVKDPILAAGWDRISLSYPEFFQVRERARSLKDLAVITTRVAIVDAIPAAEMRVGVVSASFFRMLGVTPSLGTLFDDDDDLNDRRTVVIGHDTWRTRFASDPGIVGTRLPLRDGDRVVRGVLPAGFRWGTRQLPYHLWIPLSAVPPNERADNNRNLDAIGRLRPGVTATASADELSVILRDVFRFRSTTGAAVTPLLERQLRRVRTPLLVLLAGAILLLVIACANVAGLLSGDAASRESEMAVRASLGATHGRVLRQLLVEGIVLAGTGALGGLLVASWSIRSLVALAPVDMPRVAEIALDARVVLVAAMAAAVTAVLCALLPMIGLWRGGRALRLRSGSRGATARRRMASMLATLQIATGIALLGTAGLFARSLHQLHAVDAGFERDHLLTLRAGVPPSPAGDPERDRRYFAAARDSLAVLPGVVSVAVSSTLPLASGRSSTTLTLTDPPPGRSASFEAQRRFVSPEFLAATQMTLIDGRFFEPSDTAMTPPVTVVSREMARRLWPDGAVGRTLVYSKAAHTIVGVVNDLRDVTLDAEPQPTFYLSTTQRPAWSRMYLLVRTAGDPLVLAGAARDALARLDPDVPVEDIRTMSDVVLEATDDERYRAVLMGAFAIAATVLAGIGLYGTLARRVTERRREIGVRLALGARPAQVRRLFLAEGLRLAGVGAILGTLLAALLGQGASSLLFQVSSVDPLTLAVVTAVVTCVCLLATYIPSVRASRVDPAGILRAD